MTTSSTATLLTPSFYASYRVLPTRPFKDVVDVLARVQMALAGFRVDVAGAERIPRRPALLCTNSTHTYDFLALMKGLDQIGQRVVTVSKAKNFHRPAMAFVMRRVGVVPLASRGYFIAADFASFFGRHPRDDEYRALRDHVDAGAALPSALAHLQPLLLTPRLVTGRVFNPGLTTWRAFLEAAYQSALAETLRLASEAVHAGFHVHIYPEGTVSERLGTGRRGAAQIARALDLAMIPIGMSGCPQAFLGHTPLPRRGRVSLRVGEPIAWFDDDDDDDDAVTARLMAALAALIDPAHRHDAALRANASRAPSRGVRAHWA